MYWSVWMYNEVFVVSDIHGEYKKFKEILKYWDSNRQQLILLGDLCDRGLQSYECFYLAKYLCDNYGAILIKGNHEDLFLNFLNKTEDFKENYIKNGGLKTLESFGYSENNTFKDIVLDIKKNNDKLIEFLTYLPNFYEWNDYIFVHAGVNLKINNWKDTSIRDFMWIREDFHFTPNRLNKTIVFGHTETKILNKNNKYDIWINDNKIGIDGGAVYGGYLYGVILDVHGIKDYVYV